MNAYTRRAGSLVLSLLALAALWIPGPLLRAQDEPHGPVGPQGPQGPVAKAEVEIRGVLHHGSATAATPVTEAGSWYVFTRDGSLTALDVSAVAEVAAGLVGTCVLVKGVFAENGNDDEAARLGVSSLSAIAGGITLVVEGTLFEPEVGFDSRAAGWRVKAEDGTTTQFELAGSHLDLDALKGLRVKASLVLGLRSAFYEDRGSAIEVCWNAASVEKSEATSAK